jgi:hypothetical protein
VRCWNSTLSKDPKMFASAECTEVLLRRLIAQRLIAEYVGLLFSFCHLNPQSERELTGVIRSTVFESER